MIGHRENFYIWPKKDRNATSFPENLPFLYMNLNSDQIIHIKVTFGYVAPKPEELE